MFGARTRGTLVYNRSKLTRDCKWALDLTARAIEMTDHDRCNRNAGTQLPLGLAKRGYSGVIRRIAASEAGSALSAAELESRLIELGFVEGARVEVLHEGAVGARPDRGARRKHHHRRSPSRGHGHHRRLSVARIALMEAPLLHFALVGTPNSGKTSLFNALTGSRQKVANYPGVTVERKEGSFVTPQGPGLAGRSARHLFAARPQPR